MISWTPTLHFSAQVNVGGTGKLPMAELRSMCADAGFANVETYIASGNVVFDCDDDAGTVKDALEARLAAYAGKPVGVMVRTAEELSAILSANPFPDAEPRFTAVIFLDAPPPMDALEHATGRANETMHLGTREIYVAYPDGMGRSKLKIPAAKSGTARNLNTVAALVRMSSQR